MNPSVDIISLSEFGDICKEYGTENTFVCVEIYTRKETVPTLYSACYDTVDARINKLLANKSLWDILHDFMQHILDAILYEQCNPALRLKVLRFMRSMRLFSGGKGEIID